MIRKLIASASTSKSKPGSKSGESIAKDSTSTKGDSKDSRPPWERLEELLDEADWEEDSRVSIAELNIHHAKNSTKPPPSNKKIASIAGGIVLGILAALKTAWELGWLD